MPISGLVIRIVELAGQAEKSLLSELSLIRGLELGERAVYAVSAVLDAPSYAEHDASLDRLRETMGVSAVDIVFHDFSDVTEFGALPRRRAEAGR